MVVSDLWCFSAILCVFSVVIRCVCCVPVCLALCCLLPVGLACFLCVGCCPCCAYFVRNMCAIGSLQLDEYTALCIFHWVVCYV